MAKLNIYTRIFLRSFHLLLDSEKRIYRINRGITVLIFFVFCNFVYSTDADNDDEPESKMDIKEHNILQICDKF